MTNARGCAAGRDRLLLLPGRGQTFANTGGFPSGYRRLLAGAAGTGLVRGKTSAEGQTRREFTGEKGIGGTASAVALAGLLIALPSATIAVAAENVVWTDKSAPRSCFASVLPKNAAGADRREITSTVDGLVRARLAPSADTRAEGDWDIAVFDKATGAVVAASAARTGREFCQEGTAARRPGIGVERQCLELELAAGALQPGGTRRV